MRQVTPDVIQAHGGATIKYVLAADSAGRASSVVLRSIGLAPPQVTRGLRRQAWKRISGRAAKVIAVADAVRAQAIGTFQIEPARVVTIPNAVDPSRLRTARSPGEIRSSLGLPPAAEVVTSIGALTWEKDPRSVVEVADRVLRARQDEALFLLVGEGPLEPSVRSAIDRRGLTGRVRLLGTRPDVAEILAATDVLLLASCTEGMPGCLIEAAMAGVPVVAYAVGGVPEVVVDAATGRLAPPGHVGALANLVVELLRDVKGRAAMGARARELCRDRFDIKAVAPAYAAVYQEVGG